MGNRLIAQLTVICGLVITLVSLTADVIGLGTPPMGPRQIGGIVLGVVTLFTGLLLLRYSSGQ